MPREILYDRMKTAVIGEERGRAHRLQPHADRLSPPTTASAQGPARPIGQDQGQGRAAIPLCPSGLLPGRRFPNLEDLNAQFQGWLDTSPTPGCTGPHGAWSPNTSPRNARACRRCRPGASMPCCKLERRVSHEGMVSVGGNLYSVPDGTARGRWRCTPSPTSPHLRGRRADRGPPGAARPAASARCCRASKLAPNRPHSRTPRQALRSPGGEAVARVR